MKYIIILITAVIAMAFTTTEKKPKPAKPAKSSAPIMKTAADSFAYAYGVYCGSTIKKFEITSLNWTVFNTAIQESLKKEDTSLALKPEVVREVLNNYTREMMYGKNKTEGIAYMNKRKSEGFTITASGLMFKLLKPGNGNKPRPSDTAMVFYTGRYTDSSIFDSNIGRSALKTPCNGGVIVGFQEALLLMDEGAEAEIIIPYQLAYGEDGSRNPYTGETTIEPYKTLTFILKLEKVVFRL